jgi:hypothetical protein
LNAGLLREFMVGVSKKTEKPIKLTEPEKNEKIKP